MCWHIYLPHLFHECSLHWYLELGTPREIRIASIYHSIINVQYLQGFKCWKRPCKYVCKMFVLVFSISSEQWLEGCHVWSPWILDPNQVNLFVILWAGHFVKHHKDLNSLIKYHTSPVPYILPIKYFFCQHAMPLFCFMFRIKVFIVIVCDWLWIYNYRVLCII